MALLPAPGWTSVLLGSEGRQTVRQLHSRTRLLFHVATNCDPHPVAPESICVLQVCGRKIVRQVVQLAGLPCFWDGQYEPPPSLLKRAREYVGILANIMELPQSTGTIELLQGEPIALLLKSIGNALAKSDPQAPEAEQQQAQAQARQRSGQQAAAAASLLLDGVAAEKLQSLRALVVLMYLLGEHLGTHALQVGPSV